MIWSTFKSNTPYHIQESWHLISYSSFLSVNTGVDTGNDTQVQECDRPQALSLILSLTSPQLKIVFLDLAEQVWNSVRNTSSPASKLSSNTQSLANLSVQNDFDIGWRHEIRCNMAIWTAWKRAWYQQISNHAVYYHESQVRSGTRLQEVERRLE